MVRHKDDGYSEDRDGKTCPRDSGYDSLSNRLSILDRLLHTHPIWLQLSLSEEEAAEILQNQPPGVRPKTRERLRQACCHQTEKHLDSSRKFFPAFRVVWLAVWTSNTMQENSEIHKAGFRSRSFPGLSSCLHLFSYGAVCSARASKEGRALSRGLGTDLLNLVLDPCLPMMFSLHSESRGPTIYLGMQP